MSSRWGRAALCAVLAVLVLPAATTRASADGPATYTSWTIHQEGVGGQPAADLVLGPDDARIAPDAGAYDDPPRSIGLEADLPGDEGSMTAEFSAPDGQVLEAGHTYQVASSYETAGGTEAGLAVDDVSETHCGHPLYDSGVSDNHDSPLSLGRFTVQEIQFSGHHLTAFAATFEQNCEDVAQPATEGSIAWQASNPADAVPAPSATPGAVSDVHVLNQAGVNGDLFDDKATLTWRDPTDSAWVATVVNSAGPWLETEVGGRNQIFRGSGGPVRDDEGGNQSRYYRLTPVSALGRLGPSTTVKVIGVWMPSTVTPGTVSLGGTVLLRGGLFEEDWGGPHVDIESRVPMPGRTLSVYKRQTSTAMAPWHFMRHVTTNSVGSYTITDSPDSNTDYSVRFAGSGNYRGSATSANVALVAPVTRLLARHSSLRRRGRILLLSPGSMRGARGVVRLQRRVAGRWSTIRTTRVRGDGRTLSPRFSIRAVRRGTYVFRVAKPGDKHHVTGYSHTVRVVVR